MTCKLSELSVGSKAAIASFDHKIDKNLKRRMRDMGIVNGEIIVIKKVAPLGDPLEIIVKGYSLSLRKKEAQNIIVEKID